MNKLSEAICFAAEAFDGKRRKGENTPAIFHSLEAAAVVQSLCDDEEVVCAAILHDTVEDTDARLSEIKERFGERVAFLVESETEEKYSEKNPSDTWLQRKRESLKVLRESTDIGVRALWLGDKLSNLRSLSRLKDSLGDGMWQFFNQKEPDAHRQYYEAIAAELTAFADTPGFRELTALINKVFGGQENVEY